MNNSPVIVHPALSVPFAVKVKLPFATEPLRVTDPVVVTITGLPSSSSSMSWIVNDNDPVTDPLMPDGVTETPDSDSKHRSILSFRTSAMAYRLRWAPSRSTCSMTTRYLPSLKSPMAVHSAIRTTRSKLTS